MTRKSSSPTNDKSKQNTCLPSLFEERRLALCQRLGNAIAILISGHAATGECNVIPPTHINSNFYYFTGLEEFHTIAILSGCNPKKYVLFWQEASQHDRMWHGSKWTCRQLQKITGADAVYPYQTKETYLLDCLIGAERIYYPLGHDDALLQKIIQLIREQRQRLSVPQVLPDQICDLHSITQDFRICKQTEEIKALEQAIAVTNNAVTDLMQVDWRGHTEYEVEARLHLAYRQAGCQHAFPPIIASGSNSTVLHYTKNQRRIKSRDLLLVDTGACFQHYCADITRTWPVNGKFTREQQMVYEAVLFAQKKAIATIYPGQAVPKFHQAAVSALVDALLELKILRGDKKTIIEQQACKDFYPHSTGHWLGLDVHDTTSGYYDGTTPKIFRPGMVLTVEPGLYFYPENQQVPSAFRGIGVRIEDDILVTPNGHEILTEAVPKSVNELTKFLNRRK